MGEVNLHLLRGDDSFSIDLRLKALTQGLGADFDASMNLSRLDEKTTPFEGIQTAVSTLPFFGSCRMVILVSDMGKVDEARQDKYLALLDSVPPTTHLALVENDHQKWKRDSSGWVKYWETFNQGHWLVKWFTGHANAEIIDLPLPDAREMQNWVVAEVKRQGGKIDPAAAQELVRHTDNDTGIASQEIAKLLMYLDFQRPVTREDVLSLVSIEGTEDVFKMLDHLLDGHIREAQSMLHKLLEDTPAEVILGAFIHRFRQMLLVREVLDAREDLAVLVKSKVIFNNQAETYTSMAGHFKMATLECFYRRLLDMDVAAKTSTADLATQLEVLVVETGNYF